MSRKSGVSLQFQPPRHTLSVEDGPTAIELREYGDQGYYEVLIEADFNWPHAFEALTSVRDWAVRKNYAPHPPVELRSREEFHAQPVSTSQQQQQQPKWNSTSGGKAKTGA